VIGSQTDGFVLSVGQGQAIKKYF